MRDAIRRTPLPLLDSAGKPVPFTIDYTEEIPPATSSPILRRFRGHAAQAQLHVHPGNSRHSHPGRIRIGHLDGRRGQESNQAYTIAVIASLLIQGLFCYLFEYFAANYFLNSGYTMASAGSSAAPIGDMMIIVGDNCSDRVTASTSCWPRPSQCSSRSSAPR
jgi:APA family basic amino acid/polyamine antiporter